MTEQEYRQYPAINYSSLAKLDRNPASFLSPEQEQSDAMTFGSVLDCLLTSKSTFEDRFLVARGVDTPTGQLLTYTTRLAQIGRLDDEAHADAAAVTASAKFTPAKMREQFEAKGMEYYKFLMSSKDKTVVPLQMYDIALVAEGTLKTHAFTSKWFSAGFEQELLNQKAILFTVAGQQCKALLDIIKIDHMDKIIYPRDLKSTSDYASGWAVSSFIKWRYDLQAAFYTEAVKQWAAVHYPDYKVANFGFVVISSAQPTKPFNYLCSANDLKVGKEGGITSYGRKIKGYEQLIDDLLWHQDKGLWDYSREIYESNGELLINMFSDDNCNKTPIS